MQELMFVRKGVLEWREAAAPRLESATDALVRPLAVATCDIDRLFIQGETPFAQMGPFPLGHEFVAEIVDLGDEVHGFQLKQRVVIPFQISCGVCRWCAKGLTANCDAASAIVAASRHTGGPMYGFPLQAGGGWGGAFSDLVRVPYASAMMVAVPANVSTTAIASMSDNIPDAWRTVGPPLAETPGAEILIVGGGSLGLYAAGMALPLGAARVDYIDTDPERCKVAESYGAHAQLGPLPKRADKLYPICVDASSNPHGLACALRSLAPDGICTSIGIYYDDVALPLLEMYGRGARFHTSRASARACIPEALKLVSSGQFQPERVTTRTARWEDAIDALLDTPAKLVVSRE